MGGPSDIAPTLVVCIPGFWRDVKMFFVSKLKEPTYTDAAGVNTYIYRPLCCI